MHTRLLNLWDRVSRSFWFVPALVVLSAAAVGLLMPALDAARGGRLDEYPWWATSPEGARTVVTVIAGAMITVAGVVFSVVMVALSIASSQFGSRVLRRSLQNRATQAALGSFLGTSIFCFLVLGTIQETAGHTFVPHFSVVGAIVLAAGSIFVLLYFIHDVAESVQAPHVVAGLAADLDASIERLFPERIGDGESEQDQPAEKRRAGEPGALVESDSEGYLQAIDADTLLEAAERADVVIELCVRPGDFIALGDMVAMVWDGAGEPGRLASQVNEALIVGPMRTPRQDVNCAIHELAQLTVRALSPGINDPFSAINGIDRLAAALARLAERRIPSPYRTDAQGRLRVIAHRATFPDALAAGYNHIRQHAASAPPVGVRLLEGLTKIARRTRRRCDADAVLEQATLILQSYRDGGHLPPDLQGIERQYLRVQEALEDNPVDEHPRRSGTRHPEPPARVASNGASAAGEVNG